jgi:hypothetical protein
MRRDKESAMEKYMEIMKKSWTYSRLTEEERERLCEAIRETKASGTFEKRFEMFHAVNYAFLLGVGYSPIGWRETDDEAPKF